MTSLLNRAGWVVAGVLALLVVASLAGVVHGGPLDPPSPPASSPGGIDGRIPLSPSGCCPITISAPGSYYLKGDAVLPSAQPEAVLITSSDVTLDLNGFVIDAQNFGDGIVASGSLTRITIRNGSVSHALSHAINLGGAVQSVLQDLNVQQNQAGVAVTAGEAVTVRDVTVWATVGSGFSLGPVADVQGCTVDGFGNTNAGTIGLQVGVHSRVDHCSVAYFNTGISAGAISRVSDCVVRFEYLAGIAVGDTSTIERCTASDVSQIAINVGVASRVSDCDVRNGLVGVQAAVGSTVEGCTVGSISGTGIEVTGNGVVQGNHVDTVTGVGSCGIFADGSAYPTNRVDSNYVINSYKGICVSGGSTVSRNALRNNTFNIQAVNANDVGPVGTAASATSPWANIVY